MPLALLIRQNQEYELMDQELQELRFAVNEQEVQLAELQEENLLISEELQDNQIQMQTLGARTNPRVYLTFDDGPSGVTEGVLDILKEEGVHGSFFVLGAYPSEYKEELLRRIVNEGHCLGNHSYSHRYGSIYQSRESFWQDFKRNEDYLLEVTGVRPIFTRFPGGSRGSYINRSWRVMEALRQDMDRLGYIYVDWNVVVGDVNKGDAEFYVEHVVAEVQRRHQATVLFHDTDNYPEILEALPEIIGQLKELGYEIAALDPREFYQRY